MATVQIKSEAIGQVKDIKSLFANLNEKYDGKWVAILENGEVISTEKLGDLRSKAGEKSSSIATFFRASKKGQMLLL